MSDSFFYRKLLAPLLFLLDPEDAHDLVLKIARYPNLPWEIIAKLFTYQGDDLKVNLAGIALANPVGLAAGFDKNALLTHVFKYLGFGFAEVGSVTGQASVGNPKPRIFRLLADEALINRLGLNGEGADCIAQRLSNAKLSIPTGVNIAPTNKPGICDDTLIEDMFYTFSKLKDLPIDYVAINVSCPNTPEGVIRQKEQLSSLCARIQQANQHNLPIFVKLSPDSSEDLIADIVEVASKYHLAGYVCGNTSVSRANLTTSQETVKAIGPGGLSGKPIKSLALKVCQAVCRLKLPEQAIIACGGIRSGQDAYDFIRNGAKAVQLYTSLIYEGPAITRAINQELSQLLARDKISIGEAVGSKCKKVAII